MRRNRSYHHEICETVVYHITGATQCVDRVREGTEEKPDRSSRIIPVVNPHHLIPLDPSTQINGGDSPDERYKGQQLVVFLSLVRAGTMEQEIHACSIH